MPCGLPYLVALGVFGWLSVPVSFRLTQQQHTTYGYFQKYGEHPQNGWFFMEKPIKMDDHYFWKHPYNYNYNYRVLKGGGGVFKGRGKLGKPKDSGREDWGTLKSIKILKEH